MQGAGNLASRALNKVGDALSIRECCRVSRCLRSGTIASCFDSVERSEVMAVPSACRRELSFPAWMSRAECGRTCRQALLDCPPSRYGAATALKHEEGMHRRASCQQSDGQKYSKGHSFGFDSMHLCSRADTSAGESCLEPGYALTVMVSIRVGINALSWN